MADPIKEAFLKAKQDIFNLQTQIDLLKREILSLKDQIKVSSVNISNPTQIPQTDRQTNRQQPPTNILKDPSNHYSNPAIQHIPTDELPQYSSERYYIDVSTGSRGVPTDRQTNQQTDTLTLNEPKYKTKNLDQNPSNLQKKDKIDKISQLEHVSSLISSLDSIKKELRHQFKHLTAQEMAVFSCIYDLENQGFIVDYSIISQKMSLSESSIRDYIQKIIKKGIPIVKIKENNKKILLKIDENLKKIASLQTLLTLRDI